MMLHKWKEVFSLSNITASTVAETLVTVVIYRFWLPRKKITPIKGDTLLLISYLFNCFIELKFALISRIVMY
jgi:hypothetical protein